MEKLIKIFLFLLVVIQTNVCAQQIIERNEFKKFYDEYNVTGSFLLYHLEENKSIVYNKNYLDSAYLPASTFKIINSLIALEHATIADEHEIIKWDSVKRGYNKWDKDQTIASALKYSAVWAYQELVKRAGRNVIQKYLDKSNYGNKNITGDLTTFWLDGNLRISPNQQLKFLLDFYNYNLPFSKSNIDIVKNILVEKETAQFTLRAKTGWAIRVSPNIGWYIGYITVCDNHYFFINNVLTDKPGKGFRSRKEITYKILNELKIVEVN